MIKGHITCTSLLFHPPPPQYQKTVQVESFPPQPLHSHQGLQEWLGKGKNSSHHSCKKDILYFTATNIQMKVNDVAPLMRKTQGYKGIHTETDLPVGCLKANK